jgi:acyl carrier protein
VFRTGDLVRRRSDGTLEHLGRIDEQVQIRGFRVEPGEVAGVLDRHAAVRSSAVVVAGDPAEPRLVAFVTLADNAVGDIELTDHLQRQLPAHLVPSRLLVLDELPVTANGKLDRAALLARLDQNTTGGAVTAPANDLERAVAEIVAERLGRPEVGTDENFFLLGGHSMLGAQLVISINERFGIEMSLRSLFEAPTVAEMAAEVERLLLADIDAMSDESVLQAASTPDGD